MTKSLRERVLEHFAALRIPLTAEELDRVLSAAEMEALSSLEVLDRLLGEQAARRRERSIERRIDSARFAVAGCHAVNGFAILPQFPQEFCPMIDLLSPLDRVGKDDRSLVSCDR